MLQIELKSKTLKNALIDFMARGDGPFTTFETMSF